MIAIFLYLLPFIIALVLFVFLFQYYKKLIKTPIYCALTSYFTVVLVFSVYLISTSEADFGYALSFAAGYNIWLIVPAIILIVKSKKI